MKVVSITDAKHRQGVRLITRRGIPTPWAQAAKSIIELKNIPCVLAQETLEERGAQLEWIGDQGSPFVAYDDEPIRDDWIEILEFAEVLAPHPRLIPQEDKKRAEMFKLADDICGKMGLGWSLRLGMIHGSLQDPGGSGTFPEKLAQYLAQKYGYTSQSMPAADHRVREVLAGLSEVLGEQPYFLGELTALDIYWAAFANMFMLLTDKELPAIPIARDAWAGVGGGRLKSEVPENLKVHHRRMYEDHLGLPVQL